MIFRIFRNWFCVLIFLIFLHLKNPVFASTWVTVASLDDNSSVIVEPQQSIKAIVNVSTWFDNSDTNDTANWFSTKYTISGQDFVCVDTTNFVSSDFHQDSFDIISPLDEGVYSITFQAFSDNNCRLGAITKSLTLTDIITIVDTTPPVITINPYNLNPTNQNITVTASTNEGLLNVSSYTFIQNASFEFIATDSAGNVARKTITIINIDKDTSVSSNNSSTTDNQPNTTTNQSSEIFAFPTSSRLSLPIPTINLQVSETDLDENISTTSGQILGSADIHDGCWLPILFIITLVINFFFIRYSFKLTNLIPFIVSVLSFFIDYLMIRKYGCDIDWLENYFWIGEISSFLIPAILKRKLFQK